MVVLVLLYSIQPGTNTYYTTSRCYYEDGSNWGSSYSSYHRRSGYGLNSSHRVFSHSWAQRFKVKRPVKGMLLSKKTSYPWSIFIALAQLVYLHSAMRWRPNTILVLLRYLAQVTATPKPNTRSSHQIHQKQKCIPKLPTLKSNVYARPFFAAFLVARAAFLAAFFAARCSFFFCSAVACLVLRVSSPLIRFASAARRS